MTREQVHQELVRLSNGGGAWVAENEVFSSEYNFRRYTSPSRVPDYLMESPDPFYTPRIGWKGRLVDWTSAAKIREQNRACGCE